MKRLALIAAAMLLGAAPSTVASAEPSPTPSNRVRPGEQTATGRTAIDDGHVDMGPRFINGVWTIQIRDDTVTPAVWRNLPDVVLQVADAGRTRIPTDERYAFLGRAGADVWLLPQVAQPGVLWPGWNTQDPEVARTVNRDVTWRLHAVEGPGHFVLFLNGNFGQPNIVFDSAKPFPQQTGVDINTHVHGNWAFTAAGTYLLSVEMAAATKTGQEVAARDTLRIFVGAGDATVAFDATPSTAPTSSAHTASTVDSPVRGTVGRWPWFAGGAAALLAAIVTAAVLRGRRCGADNSVEEG